MLHKTYPAQVKLDSPDEDETAGEAAKGVFEALVSVFHNVDSYGDRVIPGAFKRTLAEYEERGLPVPVYWSHRLDDPDMNIGHVLEAKETDQGLWVRAQLDLSAPKATTVLRLMKGKRVSQFSFSFNIAPGGSREAEDGHRELTDLDLYEVGPTPVGANPATELLGVKAGRVLSAKNESLVKQARDALTALLESAAPDDDEKASRSTGRAKDEAGNGKSEEPHTSRPVDAWSFPFLVETTF